MRLIWCPVVALLSAVPAFAADSVSLKPMFAPGMKWTFDATTALTLDNKATLNGQSQPFTFKNAQHRAGHAEVVSATDGVLTSLRVTFDDASHDDMTAGGNEQAKNFPYAGKSVTISRAANGTVTDDFQDQVADDPKHELHGMLDAEIVFLPTHAVAVGEEWTADGATLSRVLQLTGDDRAGMTLKLLGNKSVDGRDVAELKVSSVAERREGDMQVRMILQGTALIDLKTGHAVKSDLTGTLQDHGEQPGPGPDGAQVSYTVEGSGTMSSATTAPLADGAIASANPAANSATPAAAAPAENPLGAPAADPFAGTFSDGKLTVNGATKNGGYVASLSMGEQKYPATATIQNHSLSGSFDASGHPFTFTATLDGDVMTMITGGKTYSLKRTAPEAPPAPANPLGSADSPATIQKLPGYAVAVSTDAGKTLTTTKPQAHDATAAFKAVFPELASYFDERPTLGGAFLDTRDRNAATAAFCGKIERATGARVGVLSHHRCWGSDCRHLLPRGCGSRGMGEIDGVCIVRQQRGRPDDLYISRQYRQRRHRSGMDPPGPIGAGVDGNQRAGGSADHDVREFLDSIA